MALTSQLGLSLAQKQANTQNQQATTPVAPTAPASTAPKTISFAYKEKEPTYMQTSSAYTDANGKTTVNGASAKYTDGFGATSYGTEALEKIAIANGSGNKKPNDIVPTPVIKKPTQDGTTVGIKATNTSSNSQFNVPSKGGVVFTTPTTLEARLDAAKSKYGASDPRVQKIQQLMELKNSRAKNSTGNNVVTPDTDALGSKIDTSAAKKNKDELEMDPRTDNLIDDAIDTAADKNNEKTEVITDANDKTEKDTTAYADKYEAEFESYKKQLEEREASLKTMEAEQRSKIEAWNKEQNDALANRQMGNQAEATQKLGKLGASDTVLANAQNEVRNNPVFQEQKAALQKQYIDTLSSTTKDYQTMYDNIVENKKGMTESKRALAEQLLSKINENTEKISSIKQTGIDEMFKPVETFQASRIEDSSNAELSAKQNSEAQYRWAGMDESARIAKLKDALYNYDSSISRAGLSPADFEKAAKEGDITKAVAMLANSAKNLTKATTGGGSTGSTNAKVAATANTIAKKAIDGGYNTLENFTKYLSTLTISDDLKAVAMNAFKQELGWKAPLVAGRTEYEQNADVAAYKAANNIK